ncbi:MAG: hypothetical protein ACREQ4_12830 [Candidatus Binataceae bacterium]
MMVRFEIAVVTGAVMQRRDRARLSNPAQRLEGAMHRGQRNMRMLPRTLVKTASALGWSSAASSASMIANLCGVTASPPSLHRVANSASRCRA